MAAISAPRSNRWEMLVRRISCGLHAGLRRRPLPGEFSSIMAQAVWSESRRSVICPLLLTGHSSGAGSSPRWPSQLVTAFAPPADR